MKAKWGDLPLGTRFRYLGTGNEGRVYVKIEDHGCGLVAVWTGPTANRAMQEIFSFADAGSTIAAKNIQVEVIE